MLMTNKMDDNQTKPQLSYLDEIAELKQNMALLIKDKKELLDLLNNKTLTNIVAGATLLAQVDVVDNIMRGDNWDKACGPTDMLSSEELDHYGIELTDRLNYFLARWDNRKQIPKANG